MRNNVSVAWGASVPFSRGRRNGNPPHGLFTTRRGSRCQPAGLGFLGYRLHRRRVRFVCNHDEMAMLARNGVPCTVWRMTASGTPGEAGWSAAQAWLGRCAAAPPAHTAEADRGEGHAECVVLCLPCGGRARSQVFPEGRRPFLRPQGQSHGSQDAADFRRRRWPRQPLGAGSNLAIGRALGAGSRCGLHVLAARAHGGHRPPATGPRSIVDFSGAPRQDRERSATQVSRASTVDSCFQNLERTGEPLARRTQHLAGAHGAAHSSTGAAGHTGLRRVRACSWRRRLKQKSHGAPRRRRATLRLGGLVRHILAVPGCGRGTESGISSTRAASPRRVGPAATTAAPSPPHLLLLLLLLLHPLLYFLLTTASTEPWIGCGADLARPSLSIHLVRLLASPLPPRPSLLTEDRRAHQKPLRCRALLCSASLAPPPIASRWP